MQAGFQPWDDAVRPEWEKRDIPLLRTEVDGQSKAVPGCGAMAGRPLLRAAMDKAVSAL